MTTSSFDIACAAMQAAHQEDPRTLAFGGTVGPRAVTYHSRMVHWLAVVAPTASEALQLAARAQHIRRWALPRDDFPQGRAGYKRWRSELAGLHAQDAAAILAEAGYPPEVGVRVGQLLRKRRLKRDPEVQALEDAACLTFLELDLSAFMAKHDDAKVIAIVQKTWAKMSDGGHATALKLLSSLEVSAQALLRRALA